MNSENLEINPELVELMTQMVAKIEQQENDDHFPKLLTKLIIAEPIAKSNDSTIDLNNNQSDPNNNIINALDLNNNVVEDEPRFEEAVDHETIQQLNNFRILESNQIVYSATSSMNSYTSEIVLYKNELFAICFDTPTPRPHLIIRHNSNIKDPNLLNKSIHLFSKEEMVSLFRLINEFMANYLRDVNSITLSFHTGQWASARDFHAHLCMEIEDYINLFRKFKIFGPIKPTTKWVVNDKKLTTKELYLLNVRHYERRTRDEFGRYRDDDLNSIQAQDIMLEKANIARFQKRCQISFEINEPKLRFKSSVGSNYVFLLTVMCDYAKENGYFRKPNGCHICLDIAHPINTLSQVTEGFLRLSPERFYEIYPEPSIFLNSFNQNLNYFVNT